MHKELQKHARDYLKAGMAKLPENNHRVFKLMYARDNGRRSVDDAVAMNIDEVIDKMPAEQLDWAMQQVENSLKEAKA